MDHYQDVEDINVLTNKRGRVFLECGERSRVFDNVWKMKNGIIIFKGQRPAFPLLLPLLTSFQMFMENSMVKETSEHLFKAGPAIGAL